MVVAEYDPHTHTLFPLCGSKIRTNLGGLFSFFLLSAAAGLCASSAVEILLIFILKISLVPYSTVLYSTILKSRRCRLLFSAFLGEKVH